MKNKMRVFSMALAVLFCAGTASYVGAQTCDMKKSYGDCVAGSSGSANNQVNAPNNGSLTSGGTKGGTAETTTPTATTTTTSGGPAGGTAIQGVSDAERAARESALSTRLTQFQTALSNGELTLSEMEFAQTVIDNASTDDLLDVTGKPFVSYDPATTQKYIMGVPVPCDVTCNPNVCCCDICACGGGCGGP